MRQRELLSFLPVVVAAEVIVHSLCKAGDLDDKISFYGSASMQWGQMVNYKYLSTGYNLDHQWVQDYTMSLGVRTRFMPRLEGAIGLCGWIFYSAFPDYLLQDPGRDVRNAAVVFGIDRAEMIVRCSPDPQGKLCNVHIGLFQFKYNHDVRNLGEYLFRTGCYPGYINSEGFERTGAQLGGIRVSNEIGTLVRNDVFFTSELYLYPLNDFSLSFISSCTPFENRAIEIGAGLQFFRFLPVNKDFTQPRHYLTTAPQPGDPVTNYYFSKEDALHSDTLFYTFAGTKIMARFVFDPKPLLKWDFLGPEDLKLYSEAIILGVRNYPPSLENDPIYNRPINELGYDKLIEKMPVMFGLNLPAFKALDVFSIEMEYYGKKYVNRVPVITKKLSMQTLPVPYDPGVNGGYPNGDSLSQGLGTYSKETYRCGAAQWKWSVYLRKSLFGNFAVSAQAARDHMRVPTTVIQNIDQEEALIKSNQWHWVLNFVYAF